MAERLVFAKFAGACPVFAEVGSGELCHILAGPGNVAGEVRAQVLQGATAGPSNLLSRPAPSMRKAPEVCSEHVRNFCRVISTLVVM